MDKPSETIYCFNQTELTNVVGWISEAHPPSRAMTGGCATLIRPTHPNLSKLLRQPTSGSNGMLIAITAFTLLVNNIDNIGFSC